MVANVADLGRILTVFAIGCVVSLGGCGKDRTSASPTDAKVEQLLADLASKDGQREQSASRKLEEMGSAAVPRLTQVVDAKTPVLSGRVAIILGNIGPEAKAALPSLLELAEKGDFYDCPSAIYAIGRIGIVDARVEGVLLRALNNKNNTFVQEPAVGAIGILYAADRKASSPVLVDAITKILDEASVPALLRLEAARALGNMGPKAKGAIPALRKASADDTDETVRSEAAKAIRNIVD